MKNEAREKIKAELLIEFIEDALTEGVRHFNKEGKLLTKAEEILRCFLDEGSVTAEKPQGG